MKQGKYIFIGFLLLLNMSLLFFSCKKDHPNDIPKWVKETIKERKKENVGNDIYDTGAMHIEEYEFNRERIYAIYFRGFRGEYGRCTDRYYDYEGNEILHCRASFSSSCGSGLGLLPCAQTQATSFVFVRNIWTEKPY